jgi:hypothetical protein
MKRRKKSDNIEAVRNLVNEAIQTNSIEFLVKLIYNLQKEYVELAELATLSSYKSTWSHKKLLDYITRET